MSSDVDPTPKKPPEPRTEPRKRSAHWHFWWASPIVPISLMFMLAIQAREGPNDYNRDYTLAEAVGRSLDVPLSNLVLQPVFFLLPYALIVYVLGAMALRRRMSTRRFLVLAVGRLMLVTALPLSIASVVLAAMIFPLVLSPANGETYAEGYAIGCAIGWWAIYQVVILVRDTWNRVPVDDECAGCRYSREGLAADARCPECGLVPTAASRS